LEASLWWLLPSLVKSADSFSLSSTKDFIMDAGQLLLQKYQETVNSFQNQIIALDVTCQYKDWELGEKDKVIAEKDKIIGERDENIKELAEKVEALEKKLSDLDTEIQNECVAPVVKPATQRKSAK
jgi:uncharacterized protein (DUF3084 family)